MQFRLESDTEVKCCKHADNLGIPHIKLNLQGRRGWPDRVFLGEGGRTLWIEFKRKKKEPRKLQAYIHASLRARGHRVGVVDDTEVGKRILDEFRALDTRTPPGTGNKAPDKSRWRGSIL